MMRLKMWQWVMLAMPIASIIGFLMVAAGLQIHAWGLSWIWAVFTLVIAGWQWLLGKWTRPGIIQVEAAVADANRKLETAMGEPSAAENAADRAEAALQTLLKTTQTDRPLWEDGATFWMRCQELVVAIAQIYHPEVKYPLLNIYIPQAYGLIRGTVNDLDLWMQQLSPVLGQATIAQTVQAYETYQKLEPSARKILRLWNWAQWLLNPAAAVAKQASQPYSNRASQQLLVNLSQMAREAALRNLCRQAIALYSSSTLPDAFASAQASVAQAKVPTSLPKAKTQTLREILTQAEPVTQVVQKPVNILLVGRTGAGKSSLINTLFQADRAAVDRLPSTDCIQSYQWQALDETLTLWDTPGYEQANRIDFRDQVLDYATTADLLLLVTPALDPALQMDADFLKDLKAEVEDLPTIVIVTQVDRLRPIREWEPTYDWQWGDRPKEKAIREATKYRAQMLGEFCDRVLPIVTQSTERDTNRAAWGAEALSLALLETIAPAKQLRLARFLRNLEARTAATAKIIDRYTFQMTTTQGLTALLKSPVLQFISTISTGSPALAYLLAEQIPVEQLPIVIGKLQMAYDLFILLNTDEPTKTHSLSFDLRSLWPLLLENSDSPEHNAWAFGHVLVEYWTQNLKVEQLRERFDYYLNQHLDPT